MNGILGMAQLLLMPESKEDVRQEYARTILNSGETLLSLLNDILDLSKVEAGKLELQRAAFNPRQLINEVSVLFYEPIEAKGLKIEYAWNGPADVRYWGDPLRLRQMLTNLVSNATKFTSLGFVRIEGSEVQRDEEKVLLEFSVTDTGIGIAKDKLDRLFKPFSQVDGSITRQYGGSGLGLSIVANLAHLMNGETGIDSEQGKGSRFWFRVQMTLVTTEQDSRRVERPTPAETRVQGSSLLYSGSVLVVEDNSVNRMVIGGLLKKYGMHVDNAENGQEAVDLIKSGSRPNLVLMDCQMPVLDGFKATETIRAWELENNKPRLPIIALTAGAFEENRDKCAMAGMDDFLAKPLRLPDLDAVLKTWATDKPRAEQE
jgi:two-component system, sensor histidine kinase